MNVALATTNSIVPGKYYVVDGSSGSITYNGTVKAIGESFIGISGASGYSSTSGDAFVTEQLRFYGNTMEYNATLNPQYYSQQMRFYGFALENSPERYFTTRRSVRGEE